jgi:tyrosyl-DNA phosphodiesterase-1
METKRNNAGTSTGDAIVLDTSSDSDSDSGSDGGGDGDDTPSPNHALETAATDTATSAPTRAAKRLRRDDDTTLDSGAAKPPGDTTKTAQSRILRPSPIKLMATQQDEDVRKLHYEKTNNTDHWSYQHCWTLREMLGLDRHILEDDEYGAGDNRIDWMVISNYIVDFHFLLSELPELVSIPTVLVVYGHADDPAGIQAWKRAAAADARVDFVRRDPSDPPRSAANPLNVSIPYGCHHTKLFLVGYASGRLRVIVHSSNLRFNDVHFKCQGAFLQDFWPKREDQEFMTNDFEETLISYVSTYRYLERRTWQRGPPIRRATTAGPLLDILESSCCSSLMDQLSKYDFSTARGVMIPSAPGFHPAGGGAAPTNHRGPCCWGYWKVRQAIAEQQVGQEEVRRPGGSIVCQFSSIGSLSEKYLTSLWESWDVNSVGKKSTGGTTASVVRSKKQPWFQLVYPTYGEIASSVEGLNGGGSVPGNSKNVGKPFLQSLYHKWTSSRAAKAGRKPQNTTMGKGQNVPHIKTYYQVVDHGDDHQGQASTDDMHWFVLGSHNLSKGKTLSLLTIKFGTTMINAVSLTSSLFRLDAVVAHFHFSSCMGRASKRSTGSPFQGFSLGIECLCLPANIGCGSSCSSGYTKPGFLLFWG